MLSIIVMSFFRRAIDSCSPPFVKKSELNPGIMPCEEKTECHIKHAETVYFLNLALSYVMLCGFICHITNCVFFEAIVGCLQVIFPIWYTFFTISQYD